LVVAIFVIAKAELTVNVPDAFVVVVPPCAAVIVRSPLPVTVGVTLMLSTNPPAPIFADTVPANAFEVRLTFPVWLVTVFPFASWAVTRTLNALPAIFATADSAVVPPLIVTANLLSAPGVKVTFTSSVIGLPPTVPVTVDTPAVVVEVRMAV